jgi:hypothetical protein
VKSFVLTYHSHNIAGSSYEANDHVAFASDLEVLARLGAEVASLEDIAGRVGAGGANPQHPLVGISFDDGPVFDFEDFVHPQHGPQRSFLNIMRDFRAMHGSRDLPGLHATSFVIASPEARRAMERDPGAGYAFLDDWLSDHWWPEAIDSGFMEIGNHSWDHVHHALPKIATGADERDDFTLVANFRDADAEIRPASEYIKARLGRPTPLFAYPFGHVNDYLVNDYFPKHGASLGLKAAFGTGGVASERNSVWSIPRLVCGYDWRSAGELERLLTAS